MSGDKNPVCLSLSKYKLSVASIGLVPSHEQGGGTTDGFSSRIRKVEALPNVDTVWTLQLLKGVGWFLCAKKKTSDNFSNPAAMGKEVDPLLIVLGPFSDKFRTIFFGSDRSDKFRIKRIIFR